MKNVGFWVEHPMDVALHTPELKQRKRKLATRRGRGLRTGARELMEDYKRDGLLRPKILLTAIPTVQ